VAKSEKTSYVIHYKDLSTPPETMAIGTVIPRNTKNSIELLDDARDFNPKQTQNIKEQIKLCRKLYNYGGILATAIDILTEFPTTNIRIENVRDKKCSEMLKYFLEEVNADNPNTLKGLNRVVRQISNAVFLDGNAFPYEAWGTVTDKYNKKIKNVKMPVKITLLNPLNIDIPKEYVDFGYKVMFLQINEDIIKILKKNRPTEAEKELISFIPEDIVSLARSKTSWDGKVKLDNRFVTHIKRKGQDYDIWGLPYLTRVFSIAASQQRLRALDDYTTEGLINFITVWKIGDPDNEKTWAQPRLDAFANMIRNPAATNTLVWSYDIDVLTAGPQGDVLNFKDKYQQVNYDMLAALGIPEILFTGSGSQAGVWTALLSLLERLEKFRDDLAIYLNGLLRKICVENGYEKEHPQVRWARMRLRDERAAKNIVLALYDRGIISTETMLTELDYDYDTMKNLREKENENNDADVFKQRVVPWGGNNKPNQDGSPKEPDMTKQSGRPISTDKDVSIKAASQLVIGRFNDIVTKIDKRRASGTVSGTDVINEIAFAYILVDKDIENTLRAISDTCDFFNSEISIDDILDNLKDKYRTKLEEQRNLTIASVYSILPIIDNKTEFNKSISELLERDSKNVNEILLEINELIKSFNAKNAMEENNG
jgi:hypothetical protein